MHTRPGRTVPADVVERDAFVDARLGSGGAVQSAGEVAVR